MLRHLAVDCVLWAAMIAGSSMGGPAGGACAGFLFAVFSFRSFAMMHECVHSSGARRATVNTGLGTVFGLFCFLPFAGWRDMHIEHHRWTGNVDRDPTTKILLRFEQARFQLPPLMAWSWRLWLPLLGFMQHVVFWRATVGKREYAFVPVSVMYLLFVAWILGPWTLLAGLVSYLFVVEAVNLPHHLGMRQFRGDRRFHVSEQNRFTRSCVYPRWFAHHVLLNFNLHTAHHLFPSHPWYQLDALHAEVVAEGLQLNMGSGNEWIVKNRRLALTQVMQKTFATSAAEEDPKAA